MFVKDISNAAEIVPNYRKPRYSSSNNTIQPNQKGNNSDIEQILKQKIKIKVKKFR